MSREHRFDASAAAAQFVQLPDDLDSLAYPDHADLSAPDRANLHAFPDVGFVAGFEYFDPPMIIGLRENNHNSEDVATTFTMLSPSLPSNTSNSNITTTTSNYNNNNNDMFEFMLDPLFATNDADLIEAAIEKDKRRRNTAASARFRLKKKEREAELERRQNQMDARCSELQRRIAVLETENRWLRELITKRSRNRSHRCARSHGSDDSVEDGDGTKDKDKEVGKEAKREARTKPKLVDAAAAAPVRRK